VGAMPTYLDTAGDVYRCIRGVSAACAPRAGCIVRQFGGAALDGVIRANETGPAPWLCFVCDVVL
jgi:hypothetical protein